MVQLTLAHHVEIGHRRRGREEQRHVDQQHLVPAHVVADDHRRRHQHRQHAHQRVVEVGGEVEERLGLMLLLPVVGSVMRLKIFSNVLLPAPLRPMIPRFLPALLQN